MSNEREQHDAEMAMQATDPTTVPRKKGFVVEIVGLADGAVVKRLTYGTMRLAEKGERGVNINLNHAEFYTRIVEQ